MEGSSSYSNLLKKLRLIKICNINEDPGAGGPCSQGFSLKHKNIQLMKFRNILLYLTLVGGLSTSCIKEDHSDCHNVYRLAMSYMGDGTDDIFPEKISSVDLYVFDQQNNCVESFRASESDIQEQLVTLPPLAPGDYKVVCIGNAYKTKIVNLDSKDLSQMGFAAEAYINGEITSGNDSLYWSSTDYSITPYDAKKMEEVITSEFASSHYDVSVELDGLFAGTKASEVPTVEIVGLSPYTDFTNKAFGEPATYTLETDAEGMTSITSFSNIMRHTDDAVLRVSRAGLVLAEKNFSDHIAELGIEIDKQEVLIPFKIAFDAKTMEVKITAPSWYVVDVKPEF